MHPSGLNVQLLGVDGTSTDGLDTDRVVQRLRGKEGSSVLVKVARHPQQQQVRLCGAVQFSVVQCSAASCPNLPPPPYHSPTTRLAPRLPPRPPLQIPGVAGAPAPAPGAPPAPVEYRQFRLRRAQVALNPVFATPVHIADHVYGEPLV